MSMDNLDERERLKMNEQRNAKQQPGLSEWWNKHANMVHDSPSAPAGVPDPYGDNSGPAQGAWSRLVVLFIVGGASLLIADASEKSFGDGDGDVFLTVISLLLGMLVVGILALISKAKETK